jgi:hypothetical protein
VALAQGDGRAFNRILEQAVRQACVSDLADGEPGLALRQEIDRYCKAPSAWLKLSVARRELNPGYGFMGG